jgi:hypothetical protein
MPFGQVHCSTSCPTTFKTEVEYHNAYKSISKTEDMDCDVK